MSESLRILTADDVYAINMTDLPLIVNSDKLWGWWSWFAMGIRQHIHGFYSHSMVMERPGHFVTQAWTLKRIPMDQYVNGQYRLKFWQPVAWDKAAKQGFNTAVANALGQGRWHRRYDWPAVGGQWTGLRWLQIPRRQICSTRVAQFVRAAGEPFDVVQPNPEDIDSYCKNHPDRWQPYGVYDPNLL